jgi:hypothetical protein
MSDNSDMKQRYDFLMGDPSDTPPELVRGIALVPPEVAAQIWREHISDEYGHLMKMTRARYTQGVVSESIVEATFGSLQDTTNELAEALDIPGDTTLVFFQAPRSAAVTTWSTFSRHWWHFCMPTDDNNVGLFPGYDRRILYIVSRFLAQRLSAKIQLSESHRHAIDGLVSLIAP